jgi:protein-S-isoprenylcysteine O-methyltransferase Ste14
MVFGVLLLSAYFVTWAFMHSSMASLRVKQWARGVFGAGVDRWYRVAYVSFALISFVPIPLLLLIFPHHLLYSVPAPWRWLMVVGQSVGMGGAAVAIGQTGISRFVGFAQVLGERREEHGLLQVRGLYCYVRHPSYFFSLIVIWLTPWVTVNLLVLFVLFTLYFYVGSIHEERRLVAEFGAAYQVYQQHVPRLIPRLYCCHPPSRKAS